MIKITLSICLLLSAASLFGADAAAGKTVFGTKCRACHGADGQGNPAIAKAMNVDLKPFSSDEVQKKSDADLKAAITMGTGKMKPVAIAGADLDNTVAYIRTLKK